MKRKAFRNSVLSLSFAFLFSLFGVAPAKGTTFNPDFSIPADFVPLFTVTGVRIGSCGPNFHTGHSVIFPSVLTNVGTLVHLADLEALSLDASSITFRAVRDAVSMIPQGNQVFTSGTTGINFNIGGSLSGYGGSTLLAGDLGQGLLTVHPLSGGAGGVTWETSVTATRGSLFRFIDGLGSSFVTNGNLPLYMTGQFQFTWPSNINQFNRKDFLAIGDVTVYGQIPEPATAGLLLLGGIPAAMMRRRRKAGAVGPLCRA